MVADEEGVGHEGQLLAVLRGKVEGRGLLVSDNVVHEAGPAGPRIAQPHRLKKIIGYQLNYSKIFLELFDIPYL